MGETVTFWENLQANFAEIDWMVFLSNLILTAILSLLLSVFYVKFGNTVSNRRRFSRSFLPLAMTTMVIISIVKSSVQLSLGLVGALSIVRFRAAIKDPEELVYLFITIGIGLAFGANEPVIGAGAFLIVMAILAVQSWIRGHGLFRTTDSMHLNLTTSHKELRRISEALAEILPTVELKRADESDKRLDVSYVVEVRNVEQMESAKEVIRQIAPDATVSFVEQRNIAI